MYMIGKERVVLTLLGHASVKCMAVGVKQKLHGVACYALSGTYTHLQLLTLRLYGKVQVTPVEVKESQGLEAR